MSETERQLETPEPSGLQDTQPSRDEFAGMTEMQKWAILRHMGRRREIVEFAQELCAKYEDFTAAGRAVGVSHQTIRNVAGGGRAGNRVSADDTALAVSRGIRRMTFLAGKSVLKGNPVRLRKRNDRCAEIRAIYDRTKSLGKTAEVASIPVAAVYKILGDGVARGICAPIDERETGMSCRPAETKYELACVSVQDAYMTSKSASAAAKSLGMRPWDFSAMRRDGVVANLYPLVIRSVVRNQSHGLRKHTEKYIRKIAVAHYLYQQLGTLAAVGREMGVSCETVRQYLVNGERNGLFEKKRRVNARLDKVMGMPVAERAVFLRDAMEKSKWNLTSASRLLELKTVTLTRMLGQLGIGRREIRRRRDLAIRTEVVADWKRMTESLDPDAPLVHLRRSREGRNLIAKVCRYFGGIEAICQMHTPELMRRFWKNDMEKSKTALLPSMRRVNELRRLPPDMRRKCLLAMLTAAEWNVAKVQRELGISQLTMYKTLDDNGIDAKMLNVEKYRVRLARIRGKKTRTGILRGFNDTDTAVRSR